MRTRVGAPARSSASTSADVRVAPAAKRATSSRATPGVCACGGGCGSCLASADRERDAQQFAHRVAGAASPHARPPPPPRAAPPPTAAAFPRSAGRPLPADVRADFEPALHHDLGGVRVFTGDAPARAAASQRALAYTVGTDIVFGDGQYAPHTPAGRHLLAHEVAHTVQQARRGERRLDRFEARWHESAERVGLTRGGAMTNEEASNVYFGNWMRDVNQAFVPGLLAVVPPQVLFNFLAYTAMTKFGRELTPAQLGYYIPAEHIDNPAGLIAQDDLLSGQPALQGPVHAGRLGPQRPQVLDTPQEAVDARATVVGGGPGSLYAVDRTGVMGHLRRTNEHVERRLRLAAASGRTPESMMHFGAALHSIEDLFAHSNFVEIAVDRMLRRDPSFLPAYTGLTGSRLRGRQVFTFAPSLRVPGRREGAPRTRPVLTTGSYMLADTVVSVGSELVQLMREPPRVPATDAELRAHGRLMVTTLRAFEDQHPELRAAVRRSVESVPGGSRVSGARPSEVYEQLLRLMILLPEEVRRPILEGINNAVHQTVYLPLADQLQAAANESRVSHTALPHVYAESVAAQSGPLSPEAQQQIEMRSRLTGESPADLERDARDVAGRRAAAIAALPTASVAGPSHSQITKDHVNSPFFGLAFRLATEAITLLRERMIAVWGSTTPFDFSWASFPPHAPPGSAPDIVEAFENARQLYHANRRTRGTRGVADSPVRGRSVEAAESLEAGREVVREGGGHGQPYDLAAQRRVSAERVLMVAAVLEASAASPGQAAATLRQLGGQLAPLSSPVAQELARQLGRASRVPGSVADRQQTAELQAAAALLRERGERIRDTRIHAERERLNAELIAARAVTLDALGSSSVDRAVSMTLLNILDEEVRATSVTFTSSQLDLLAGRTPPAGDPLAPLAGRRLRVDPAIALAPLPAGDRPTLLALLTTARTIIEHPYETTWWEPHVRDYARRWPDRLINDIEARNEGVPAYREP